MGIYSKTGKDGRVRWFVDFYHQGGRIRECVGPLKTEAKEALEERRREIRRGQFNLPSKYSPKFKDFAQFYLDTYSVNKRSCRREKDIMAHLVKTFGLKRLSQIIPSTVEKYKGDRAKVVAKSTVNRELSLLKHIFNVAIKDSKVNSNPARGIRFKEADYFKGEGKKERILSQEEVQRLLDASASHLQPIILTALNSGMRLREILYLKLDDVDLDYRVITVRHTKSAKERKIPVNTLLLETLKTQRAKARGEWVFPCPGTDKPMDGIKTAWQGALRRAGIEHCRFHDLRHTSATYMVLNGVDLATVKEILGHSDIRLTMRYTHPTTRAKRDAVETLTWNMPQKLDNDVHIKTGHRMDTKGVCTDVNST